ncbi:MAG: PQQ-dependent sugar dehydrogenase, partial [bacterium]|nr:PQQ-dependent sugar dehydrogenase [bacterium]
LAFGPDGYLYISTGDGGGANDVGVGHTPVTGNAQDVTKLMGKILRINVNSGDPYAIPPDNPFSQATGGERPEIYAWGLRNPFRMSFDAGGTRRLFVGDVGQNLWEEVDIVTRGGNYGWNIKEGTHCFNPNDPDNPPATCPNSGPRGETLTDPIIEHGHNMGIAIIGGYVYRGSDVQLRQQDQFYVFGNWTATAGRPDGRVYVAMPPASGSGMWTFRPVNFPGLRQTGRLDRYLLAFGQGADNELYLLTSMNPGPSGSTGAVFKMVPPTGDGTPGAQATVTMRNSQFQPQQITIRRGTTVTWVNRDPYVHTVTSGQQGRATGMFDATVNSGQRYSFTFTQTGTYPYHCRIHSGMTGTVIVTE